MDNLLLVIHSSPDSPLLALAMGWNIGMEPVEFESSLITELNRVLLQAAQEVESEERLDLAYEVQETVRFEQAHVSWLDRLRNTASPIELRLAHAQLPLVVGEVRHLADPFMILEDSTTQFLVNFEFVSVIRGLSDLAQNSAIHDTVNWLDNVWFHDLADRQLVSTWYLAGDHVIEGMCRRTGFDSLDIEANTKVFTIPKRSIVASRTVLLSRLN